MEVSDGVFNTYVILLAIAGVVMLVVACLPLKQGTASRVIGAVLGLGFLGYAIYLEFIFDGGSFAMFYYVFVVPFIYIGRVVKAYADRRRRQDAQMQAYPSVGYGQPSPYGQPSRYGQPGSYGPPPTGTAQQPGAVPPPPPPA